MDINHTPEKALMLSTQGYEFVVDRLNDFPVTVELICHMCSVTSEFHYSDDSVVAFSDDFASEAVRLPSVNDVLPPAVNTVENMKSSFVWPK